MLMFLICHGGGLQHHLFELGDSGEEINWERNQASESESSVTWEKD